mmetsp:Transcript_38155/g.95735  ORF Transcript_38155/g.95735 Transcript_38155/m.95735 type:complete len:213 (+) Transcript_38155:611-1249(+)
MVPAVQLTHQHDVTYLAVLVCLGTVELATIHHRDLRALHSLLQALKFTDVGKGRNHSSDLLVVDACGHRTKDDAPRWLHPAVLQIIQEEVAKQKVAEVIGGKTQLMAVCGPPRTATGEEPGEEGAWLVSVREVHSRIAHERVEWAAERTEGLNELPDTVVRAEVTMQHCEAVFRKIGGPGDLFSLLEIAARHDDIPLAAERELLRGSKAQTR